MGFVRRIVWKSQPTIVRYVAPVGAAIGVVALAAGATAAVLNLLPSVAATRACKTIITDPNPPLNVRSSPIVATPNIIGRLDNGTRLTVVGEEQGWLRISAPIEGWIYKDLTLTRCATTDAIAALRPESAEHGAQTLAEATEYYHAGNLNAAIALAQTIAPQSPVYPLAKTAIVQWRQDWQTAEARFYTAQRFLSHGNWDAALNQVKDYPNNRFWYTKLTPLMRRAIEQQALSK